MEMILFLIVVLLVYGLLNFYFIHTYHSVFINYPAIQTTLNYIFILILLSPIAAAVLSSNRWALLSRIVSYIGYYWIIFLFLFLMSYGFVTIVLLPANRIGVFVSIVLINVVILVYGSFNARNPQIKRLTIYTSKLPTSTPRLSIMQISDVHFSPIVNVDMAKKIRDAVIKEKPDMIISTGDFLDRGIYKRDDVVRILKSLTAPLGKFSITGNHEFYVGINESKKFNDDAGFKLLRNETVVVHDIINLMSVDDPASPEKLDMPKPIQNSYYTVLLKHQPRINPKSIGLFDLQLSGHTHGGQIFPLHPFVKLIFPYFRGFYSNDRFKLNVSYGTGTWGPPVRFLAPPEITMIELKRNV